MALDGKGEAEEGSKGNYPNLLNFVLKSTKCGEVCVSYFGSGLLTITVSPSVRRHVALLPQKKIIPLLVLSAATLLLCEAVENHLLDLGYIFLSKQHEKLVLFEVPGKVGKSVRSLFVFSMSNKLFFCRKELAANIVPRALS